MVRIEKTLGVLQQAIEIEKFGYKLYTTLRRNSWGNEARKLLSRLSKFEAGHIKWLENEYERRLNRLEVTSEEDPVRISVPAKAEIFLDDERLAEIIENPDPVEFVEFALDVEKRSVEFYEKNMRGSDDEGTAELLARLVEFEKDHVEILRINMERLEAGESWFVPEQPHRH